MTTNDANFTNCRTKRESFVQFVKFVVIQKIIVFIYIMMVIAVRTKYACRILTSVRPGLLCQSFLSFWKNEGCRLPSWCCKMTLFRVALRPPKARMWHFSGAKVMQWRGKSPAVVTQVWDF